MVASIKRTEFDWRRQKPNRSAVFGLFLTYAQNARVHAKSVELDLGYYENSHYHDALQRAQEDAAFRPTRILNGLVHVGQSGIESSFDRYLRGQAGQASLRVDSLGRPRGRPIFSAFSQRGLAVRLTLDADLQYAAQKALVYGIDQAIRDKQWYADGGAIVALDPRTGAVRAMASYPTFDPKVYVGKPNPSPCEHSRCTSAAA